MVPLSRLTPSNFEHRSAVILNAPGAIPQGTEEQLKRFVEQGGGLFVAVGERTSWSSNSALWPGALGQMVDRSVGRQATLGKLENSHPIFELFVQPHSGNFNAARFYRYRVLTPGPNDRVLASFDDGTPAMVERRVGAGRVIAFTSSLDTSWNTLPVNAVFVPMVQLTARYLARYEDPAAWYTVGRMLDISAPIGQIVREGAAADTKSAPRKAAGVVMAPSGTQATLGEGSAAAIRLEEQGFYSVRLQGTGDRRP